MAVTEMEQIEAEIAAIFSVRPASDCNILDRLEVGKEMMSEVFLFGQYRGFALYDGLVANFKMAWDDEEDGPPPTVVLAAVDQRGGWNVLRRHYRRRETASTTQQVDRL